MFNTQLNITEKLDNCLEKCIMLNKKLLKNLIAIVLGVILSKSSVPADMAVELKDSYTVDSRMLNKYLELVGDFKKYAITNYEDVFKTKNCNSYCKVALNSEHMKFCLEKEKEKDKIIKKFLE